MPAVRFTGGGSLDGRVMDLAGRVTTVTTAGGSYYEIDDADEAQFAGFGTFGREASMIIRRQREATAQEQGAVLAAAQPRGCERCGRTFADLASYTVHQDPVQGCLPGDAYGQLEEVDGVWRRIGSGR